MPNGDVEVVVLPGGCRIIIDDLSTSNLRGAGINANGEVSRIVGITGYAEECARVRVSIVGVDAPAVEADVDSTTRNWAVPDIVLNTPANLCDTTITLKAECTHNSDCVKERQIFQLPCNDCPMITGVVDADGDCIEGQRVVIFSLIFDPPLPVGASVSINWAYDGGLANEGFTVEGSPLTTHSHSRSYPAGTFSPGAFVEVTLDGTPCDDISIEFSDIVVQSGCDDPLPCPDITIDVPLVTGCAPSDPSVAFSASVQPPPPGSPPTEYRWTLTDPGGQDFSRTTTTPDVATSDAWLNLGTGSNVDAIDLNTPGPYSVTVSAEIPNTTVDCTPGDTRTFTVEACPECPTLTLDDPLVTGCVPNQAQVSFAVTINPPGTPVTSYDWDIGFVDAGGATLTTTTPEADSGNAAWSHSDGSTATLQADLASLNQISVTANVANLPNSCTPPIASRQFIINGCPPPPTNGDGEVNINWCLIWFIANIFLMLGTGVLIFITFCVLNAAVWTAISAIPAVIASGGGLAAVFGPVLAALTTVEIILLIASAVMVVVTLVSFVLWIIFCPFGDTNLDYCFLLAIQISILTIVDLLSLVVAFGLLIAGQFLCSVGAFIDVAWFSVLLTISWWLAFALGCRLQRPR
jgi:hypothetical protein